MTRFISYNPCWVWKGCSLADDISYSPTVQLCTITHLTCTVALTAVSLSVQNKCVYLRFSFNEPWTLLTGWAFIWALFLHLFVSPEPDLYGFKRGCERFVFIFYPSENHIVSSVSLTLPFHMTNYIFPHLGVHSFLKCCFSHSINSLLWFDYIVEILLGIFSGNITDMYLNWRAITILVVFILPCRLR